jgi:uncharacterized DUF497 family protein
MITYDETKRQANIAKHGLDLLDAALVYDAPDKITLESPRGNEDRRIDIALVEVMGVVLALVYVERGSVVRAISLRRASKAERRLYEIAQQD